MRLGPCFLFYFFIFLCLWNKFASWWFNRLLFFIYLATSTIKYWIQKYKKKKKVHLRSFFAYPSTPNIKNMHLRSGNKYLQQRHDHKHETIKLRFGRTYQRYTRAHHPNHHRNQHRLKAKRRYSWDSLPSELQYEIMTLVLHNDKPLALPKIFQYARICRSWRLRVAEYIYHEEPNPAKLLHNAAKNNKVGVVKLLIHRPDFHQHPLRTFKLNNLLRVAASARATEVVQMVLDTPECFQDYVDWDKLISIAAMVNDLTVVSMIFQRSKCLFIPIPTHQSAARCGKGQRHRRNENASR